MRRHGHATAMTSMAPACGWSWQRAASPAAAEVLAAAGLVAVSAAVAAMEDPLLHMAAGAPCCEMHSEAPFTLAVAAAAVLQLCRWQLIGAAAELQANADSIRPAPSTYQLLLSLRHTACCNTLGASMQRPSVSTALSLLSCA